MVVRSCELHLRHLRKHRSRKSRNRRARFRREATPHSTSCATHSSLLSIHLAPEPCISAVADLSRVVFKTLIAASAFSSSGIMSSLNVFPSLSTLFRVFSLLSVLSVSSIASLLYLYQGKLIYPSNLPAGARTDTTNPSDFSLPFEDLALKTPDGEKLQAWFIRPDEKGQERKMTVVMFQANAGNIAHRLPLAAIFYKRLAVNVLMLSYRGYGLSTGSPNEAGIKIDAQVALDWLKARLWPESKSKREGIDSSSHNVILYGQSLGGAVAIDAAVRNGNWVRGLILENTFLDIPSLIPSVLPPARFFTWLCREVWSSRTRLPQLDKGVKVLFLSGKDDELVPPSQMRELYRVCRHKEGSGKEWSEFEEGTHNDTCMKVSS